MRARRVSSSPQWCREKQILRSAQDDNFFGLTCAKRRLGENGLVLAICAFEIGDFMGALEVPDSGRDFINQILVMRDQQHRSRIALQRNVEGVDRFEIQWVGGRWG